MMTDKLEISTLTARLSVRGLINVMALLSCLSACSLGVRGPASTYQPGEAVSCTDSYGLPVLDTVIAASLLAVGGRTAAGLAADSGRTQPMPEEPEVGDCHGNCGWGGLDFSGLGELSRGASKAVAMTTLVLGAVQAAAAISGYHKVSKCRTAKRVTGEYRWQAQSAIEIDPSSLPTLTPRRLQLGNEGERCVGISRYCADDLVCTNHICARPSSDSQAREPTSSAPVSN